MTTSLPRRGRPAGTGTQQVAIERVRQSRRKNAASGGLRLDMTIDADTARFLAQLMSRWRCKTRKEAVQKAIHLLATSGIDAST